MPHERRPSDADGAESPAFGFELQRNELWSRWHNQVADQFAAGVKRLPAGEAPFFSGLLEITNFMLKNTCGVGSNIKLAECGFSALNEGTIRTYYALILTALVVHVGELLPPWRDRIRARVKELSGDAALVDGFARELEDCRDHQDGSYSPVRAGRKLWDRIVPLLNIQNAGNNMAGRIYYQTAPGQDLVFLVEKAQDEGWLPEV